MDFMRKKLPPPDPLKRPTVHRRRGRPPATWRPVQSRDGRANPWWPGHELTFLPQSTRQTITDAAGAASTNTTTRTGI